MDSVIAAAKPVAIRTVFDPPGGDDTQDDAEDVDEAVLSSEDDIAEPVHALLT
jgi:hypothetical protein